MIPKAMTKEEITRRSLTSARRRVSKLITLVTACALASTSIPVHAQQSSGLPMLRDSETEQLLRDYTRPILNAAGLQKHNIQMVIINDKSFNAFVADGRRIFVNYGAIMQSTTPNQLIGVLAHETGHLAGGHLSKFREQLPRTQTQLIIAMLLGAGALAAGAGGGSNGAGSNIGAAAISAPQEIARRSLLGYQRQQEENADRAGVKFLNATGQSAKGCTRPSSALPMKACSLRAALIPTCSRIRCRSIASPRLQNSQRPVPIGTRRTIRRYRCARHGARQDIGVHGTRGYRIPPLSDVRHQPARPLCARHQHIPAWRSSLGLEQIDALIKLQPQNPYFHEVRGQALLEGGRPAEAIAPLRLAVKLSQNAPLIEMLLGQALVASNNKANADEAITILRAALGREPEAPLGYMQLAIAYGRKGDYAQADLASAQAAFMRGDNKTARELASRAKTRFAIGTPGWVKADDIVSAKLPDKKD